MKKIFSWLKETYLYLKQKSLDRKIQKSNILIVAVAQLQEQPCNSEKGFYFETIDGKQYFIDENTIHNLWEVWVCSKQSTKESTDRYVVFVNKNGLGIYNTITKQITLNKIQ